MLRVFVLFSALLLSSVAFAQQQPDPAFLQKAIAALQIQRNQALDAYVVDEAKIATLNEEIAKANARIKELEPKPEAPKE